MCVFHMYWSWSGLEGPQFLRVWAIKMKVKSCFSVGVWKSGHERQQSNKQKQQFSNFPPSCAASLQVSKPELSLGASHFGGPGKMSIELVLWICSKCVSKLETVLSAHSVCNCILSIHWILIRCYRPEVITALVKQLIHGGIVFQCSLNRVSPDATVQVLGKGKMTLLLFYS